MNFDNVKDISLNGKAVSELYINGKQCFPKGYTVIVDQAGCSYMLFSVDGGNTWLNPATDVSGRYYYYNVTTLKLKCWNSQHSGTYVRVSNLPSGGVDLYDFYERSRQTYSETVIFDINLTNDVNVFDWKWNE